MATTVEPDWDYNKAKGSWDQSHFVGCILEGLRQVHAKTLNYAKLTNIEQEEKEAPGKFLDRLRVKEETDRTGSILKAGFHLGSDFGL